MELNMVGIVLAVLFIIGFVAGIRLMQSPRTALWGNRLGALSMAMAIVYTLWELDALAHYPAWLALALGGFSGFFLGRGVKMIHMPQTVALLNGLGGGASALVAGSAVSLLDLGTTPSIYLLTASLALGVGSMTLSGSMVASLKLQGWVFQRPVHWHFHNTVLTGMIAGGAFLILASMFFPVLIAFLLIVMIFFAYGIVMAVRIGGADMPVIISLLNALSGVAASISGLAVGNTLLVAVGALVGVAGLILTRIMCKAMNRSLSEVLAGLKPEEKSSTTGNFKVNKKEHVEEDRLAAGEADKAPDYTQFMQEAQRIVIVPGYGMAVAQAQAQVKDLADMLEAKGKDVKFAIHPVAGRMPGHMNVLLAEVGIDYEKLMDIDTANPQFKKTDLVIVVGACDVINPAAHAAEGTPIYGMPILEVEAAKHIIICNLDEKPGYSGVENTLYKKDNVIPMWGNAAETIPLIKESLS